MNLKFFSLLFVSFTLGIQLVQAAEDSTDSEQTCLFNGQCGLNFLNYPIPCVNTSAPYTLNPDEQIKLASVCPSLANNTEVCCLSSQIEQMQAQFTIPMKVFGHCPSCFYNFLTFVCNMVCSPVQSTFMKITQQEPAQDPAQKGLFQVDSIEMSLEQEFAERFFNSCYGIYSPTIQQKAVAVFCLDMNNCNWDTFMQGYSENSPFSIQFDYVKKQSTSSNQFSLTPSKLTSYLCNESVPNYKNQSCGCIDCEQVCKYPPPPAEDIPITWFGVYFMYIVAPIGFLALTTGLTVKIVHNDRKRQKESLLPNTCEDFDNDELSINDLATINTNEKSEDWSSKGFRSWATWCAANPIKVLFACFVLVCVLSANLVFFEVTTDPVELWSAPNSISRGQKNYFDKAFGPFYRVQQVVIKNLNATNDTFEYNGKNYTGVFDYAFVRHVFELHQKIITLSGIDENGKNVTLNQVCYSPLSNGYCVIQSPMAYFQDNITNLNSNYMDTMIPCIGSPVVNTSCFGEYGGPAFPYLAFGGFDDTNYNSSTSIIITIMLNNHLSAEALKPALAWEKAFLQFISGYVQSLPADIDISYYSERSIEDELKRQSWSDVWIIAFSYFMMFVYVSVSLGQFVRKDRLLIDSKIGLGLAGVLIVICSVSVSLAILSLCGMKGTLIVIEVIPFLVLAIGVDNIFIIVQTFQQDDWRPDESIPDKVGRIYGQVGPSLMLAFIAEATCFFFGALSNMPCIRSFAINAGLALIVAFLLQMSAFIALLSLDTRRQVAGRYDLFLCKASRRSNSNQNGSEYEDDDDDENLFAPYSVLTRPGLLHRFFANTYAPFLMQKTVRYAIIMLFVTWTSVSICFVHKVDIGLDQALSMSKDSYVTRYFNDQRNELRVGPPVYFMLAGAYNYSDLEKQKYICAKLDCEPLSLVNYIALEQKRPNTSYIAEYSNNWLDQYQDWVSNENCFQVLRSDSHTFCPPQMPNRTKLCQSASDANLLPDDNDDRILPAYFNLFLRDFLQAGSDRNCPFGGHAAYSSSIYFENSTSNQISGSSFMTYYTPLKSSDDFTGALKSARQISSDFELILHDNLNETDRDVQIYTYSIFHVYYEQFLTMQQDAFFSLSISIGTIFICSFLLFGYRIKIALILTLVILSVLINMMSAMYLWDISLNAVSLVNLVITIGISVEFCSHITYDFVYSHEDKQSAVDRAQNALAHMGASVLSGITLTKFIGIVVLAFAHSQIFQVFYFRMYFLIVIFGALHGLVLLPPLLSIFG